jgi:hypothetical protein
MGWGLDARWSAIAVEHGWPIGVIDVTPVRHLRPVASDYPRDAAIAEAEAFLDGRAYITRADAGDDSPFGFAPLGVIALRASAPAAPRDGWRRWARRRS